MINELLDKATELQKQVQLLVSELRDARKENALLKSRMEKLKDELEISNEKRGEFKSILDNNTLISGLEKKEDIRELRLHINELIRQLDRAIILVEQEA
jgi:hypothetical protein